MTNEQRSLMTLMKDAIDVFEYEARCEALHPERLAELEDEVDRFRTERQAALDDEVDGFRRERLRLHRTLQTAMRDVTTIG
jgi:uncharacterized protein YdcH (DUF465 family)